MTRFERAMMDMAVAYRLGSPESRAIITALDHARAVTAIADTHPKDGDVKQAPLVSGGGAEGNRPEGSMTTLSSHKYSMKEVPND